MRYSHAEDRIFHETDNVGGDGSDRLHATVESDDANM